MEKLLVLGRDYTALGEFSQRSLHDIEVAISPGADANSPSFQFKANARYPNEDGLLVIVDGERCLLAVADAHFGLESSHLILERLAEQCTAVPTRPGEMIMQLMRAFAPAHESGSATTLLLACLDRASGKGFGLSYGDSSLVTLGAAGATLHNPANEVYLTLDEPPNIEDAVMFDFQLEPAGLLLLYTDGVNECQYRSAETSITLRHLESLPREGYCKELVQLALKGIPGFPGGQDNVAVIAVPGPA